MLKAAVAPAVPVPSNAVFKAKTEARSSTQVLVNAAAPKRTVNNVIMVSTLPAKKKECFARQINSGCQGFANGFGNIRATLQQSIKTAQDFFNRLV